jgi:hypothetical protein
MVVMAKTKKKSAKQSADELDSVYFLKLFLYLILGTQWLWLVRPDGGELPIPVGLLFGLMFALHDHFRIDRKIEFAVLLVSMLVGYMAGIGIFISL